MDLQSAVDYNLLISLTGLDYPSLIKPPLHHHHLTHLLDSTLCSILTNRGESRLSSRMG